MKFKLPTSLITCFVLIIIVSVFGCSKKDEVEPLPAKVCLLLDESSADTTVRISYLLNNEKHYLQIPQKITTGHTKPFAVAECISVFGSDIYIGGIANDSAGYWKNEKFHAVVGNDLPVTAIATNGKDVYTLIPFFGAQIQFKILCYKNNAVFSQGGGAVAVSGNDVYILAGNILYKNNIPTDLSDKLPIATAMAVNGKDVYIGGAAAIGNDTYMRVLKNGEIIFEARNKFWIKQLVIDNNDLYIAANSQFIESEELGIAAVWKNNEQLPITIPANTAARLNGIAVNDGNVYCAGYLGHAYNGTSEAAFWQNGKLNKMGKQASIIDIAIVK